MNTGELHTSPDRCWEIIRQILDALSYVHEASFFFFSRFFVKLENAQTNEQKSNSLGWFSRV